MPEWLERDLIVPAPLQCQGLMQGGFDSAVMWFSSGGTISHLHIDYTENIHCVYRGAKDVVLINTTQYENIKKKLLPHGSFSYNKLLNTEAVDLSLFPEFKGLQYFSTRVAKGDCIYIPHEWMHYVRQHFIEDL